MNEQTSILRTSSSYPKLPVTQCQCFNCLSFSSNLSRFYTLFWLSNRELEVARVYRNSDTGVLCGCQTGQSSPRHTTLLLIKMTSSGSSSLIRVFFGLGQCIAAYFFFFVLSTTSTHSFLTPLLSNALMTASFCGPCTMISMTGFLGLLPTN